MIKNTICPTLQSQGVCMRSDCNFQHDAQVCNDCRVVCVTDGAYRNHLGGKKHRSRTRAKECPHPPYCTVCKVDLGTGFSYPQHARGRRHQRLLKNSTGASTHDEEQSIPFGQVYCVICDAGVLSDNWDRHVTQRNHRKKEKVAALQAAFNEADKDKHGITLTVGENSHIDFGIIEYDSLQPDTVKTLKVDFLSTTPASIDIINATLSSSRATRRRASSFKIEELEFPRRLPSQKQFSFNVNFEPCQQLGRFRDRLEVIFQHTGVPSDKFAITRSLTAMVGNRVDLELLKPTEPYKSKPQKVRTLEREVIRGVQPDQIAEIQWVVHLPLSQIPKSLDALLSSQHNTTIIMDSLYNWLPAHLDSETYARHFQVLLHVEEAQMNHDIQHYDQENVTPVHASPYYRLEITGLAEKRPSVIIGDRILIQSAGSSNSGRWFEGYVHQVQGKFVDLKLNNSFNSYAGEKFNIRFKVGRVPLRRMHQALTTAFALEHVLFPTETDIRGRTPPSSGDLDIIRPVNRIIKSNFPQMLAVGTILKMPPGSVPFVVFGPPGTGKTVTIVEAINQILLSQPDARILACAPSNSAADLLAERLKSRLFPSDLFRLNAPSRDKKSMPKILDNYARTNTQGTFSVPPLEELKKFRVIVCTCLSASVPYGIGMQRGHFTHIFIDEAGQAMEPEAMVPIKTLADNATNIILSGDPKQLGPVIRSAVARNKLRLDISYLERLMTKAIYANKKNNGITVVKLIKNWRSHEAILKYPNEQFYNGELEAHGDVVVTHSLLRSDAIVQPGFPVVFHAIIGKDKRESTSPSFFNPHEASLVKRYVEILKNDKKLRLTDSQIGIITPYHRQVQKIQMLIDKKHPGIKVGSVEEFQGQERRVIIISTVRSDTNYLEFDIRHTLGFVANPRRFNVAVTRAQALLIVIGDPEVLFLDDLWRGFMNYIYNSGGWCGCEPSWDTREKTEAEGGDDTTRTQLADLEIKEELIKRTKTPIMKKMKGRRNRQQEGDAQADRPWRVLE